jgi:hypothetical protein
MAIADKPNVAKVTQRLLAAHSTSGSTERNWTLWGRLYTSARAALALELTEADHVLLQRWLPRC